MERYMYGCVCAYVKRKGSQGFYAVPMELYEMEKVYIRKY